MRRAFIVLLLLAITAAATWTILRWNNTADRDADPWRAVPAHVALIIEVPDAWAAWDRFTHTSLFWSAWEQQPAGAALSRMMAKLTAAREKDPVLHDALPSTEVIVALVRNGAQGTVPLFVGSVHGTVPLEAIASVLGVEAGDLPSFGAGEVVQAKADGSLSMSVAVHDGVWMLSSSPELVAEALVQFERGSPLTADPLFARAQATLGAGADAHVLLHTTRALGVLHGTWEKDRLEQLEIPEGWIALDLSARPEAILLSGLLFPTTPHSLLTTITDQGSGPWNIGRVLPENVVQWEVHHVSNAEQFLSTVHRSTESLPSTEGLFPWAYGSVGVATALDTSGLPRRRWLVMNTEDPEGAREALSAPCGATPCDTLNHRGERITHFATRQAYEQLLGRKTLLPQQPWWAILGRTVVMSDDLDAVRASIDTWNDGHSLAENKRANSWFQQMSDEASLTWWCDLARAGSIFHEGLSTANDSAFAAWLPILSDLGGLSVQVAPAQHGLAHVTIGLQHAPLSGTAQAAPASNVVWTCAIDAPIDRRPDIVINHTNNTREVLVQDTLNRIHLISAAGKLLWTHSVDGAIMGAIHQVDRFQNGKLQLLFNTATRCYLIDRNGADVAGFPYALKSRGAVALSVFDYDRQRDYRVLIPTEDRQVMNLTLDGTPVKGWEPPKMGSKAIDVVHHLRVRNKDYLLLIDDDGGMLLLDRKGNERERVNTKLARIKSVQAVVPGGSLMGTLVHWTDQDLVPHATTLEGEEVPAALDGLRPRDLDADGGPELIRTTGDNDMPPTQGKSPPIMEAYSMGTDSMGLGVIMASTGKAWQFLVQATAPPGPSGEGSRSFILGDLNLDGAPEMVSARKDGKVIAYRMPVQ